MRDALHVQQDKEEKNGEENDTMRPNFTFKSTGKLYLKEQSGRKNNTIRLIDLEDERFLNLIYWLQRGFGIGDVTITIVGENGKFTRNIQDISIYKEWVVITWEHADQEVKN